MQDSSLHSSSSTELGRDVWEDLQQFTTVLPYIFTKTVTVTVTFVTSIFSGCQKCFSCTWPSTIFVCKSLADNHFNKADKGHKHRRTWKILSPQWTCQDCSLLLVSAYMFPHIQCVNNDYNPTCNFSSLT